MREQEHFLRVSRISKSHREACRERISGVIIERLPAVLNPGFFERIVIPVKAGRPGDRCVFELSFQLKELLVLAARRKLHSTTSHLQASSDPRNIHKCLCSSANLPFNSPTYRSGTVAMSNRNPMEEYMQRLQAVARNGRGGFPSGKPPQGTGFAIAGAVALLAGGYFFSNALFNVDGGHRAIKYRRINGVSKEIYAEGESVRAGSRAGAGAGLKETRALTLSEQEHI